MSRTKSQSATDSTEELLSPDRIHKLLAGRRRRYTLYCLYLFAESNTLSDVATQIMEWEQSRDDIAEDQMQVYLDLYHVHIPKLAAADVVTYNQEKDIVTLSQKAPQLRSYLEYSAEPDLNGISSQGF